jgi:hypothetical protein
LRKKKHSRESVQPKPAAEPIVQPAPVAEESTAPSEPDPEQPRFATESLPLHKAFPELETMPWQRRMWVLPTLLCLETVPIAKELRPPTVTELAEQRKLIARASAGEVWGCPQPPQQPNKDIAELCDQINKGISELREQLSKQMKELPIAELRDHIDKGISELHDQLDKGISELRDQLSRQAEEPRPKQVALKDIAELHEQTDKRISELGDQLSKQLKELRSEQAASRAQKEGEETLPEFFRRRRGERAPWKIIKSEAKEKHNVTLSIKTLRKIMHGEK